MIDAHSYSNAHQRYDNKICKTGELRIGGKSLIASFIGYSKSVPGTSPTEHLALPPHSLRFLVASPPLPLVPAPPRPAAQ